MSSEADCFFAAITAYVEHVLEEKEEEKRKEEERSFFKNYLRVKGDKGDWNSRRCECYEFYMSGDCWCECL